MIMYNYNGHKCDTFFAKPHLSHMHNRLEGVAIKAMAAHALNGAWWQ